MANDEIFTALADPTRRLLLEALKPGERTVGSLVEELEVSQPTVSKHLKVLREAELVLMRADGQRRFYTLSLPALATAAAWVGSFLPVTAPVLTGAPGTSGPLAARALNPVSGSANRMPAAAAAASTPVAKPASTPARVQLPAAGVELETVSAGAQASAAAQQLGRTVGRTVEQVTGRAADLLERLPKPKFGRRR